LEDILKNINSYNTDVRNNAGGVYNHTFFWNLLSPTQTLPTGKLKMDILSQWGSIDDFIAEFIEVGKKKFGSGWVWLVWNEVEEGLKIISTPNQDNPLMFDGMIPIIGCDLWEHAYYLKHKSNREGWLNTFFKILNWDYASKVYNDTVK
jgi:Fe-Mn family superoxide dismutase